MTVNIRWETELELDMIKMFRFSLEMTRRDGIRHDAHKMDSAGQMSDAQKAKSLVKPKMKEEVTQQ